VFPDEKLVKDSFSDTNHQYKMAGDGGFEPPTSGFGGRFHSLLILIDSYKFSMEMSLYIDFD
jgi:hypothetical protein